MFKNYLISLTLLTSSVSVAAPTLNILSENGKARFQIDEGEGYKPITIHPAFVDTSLRSIDRDSLLTMMARGDGYLKLTRNDHGEYGIGLRVRGNGGGLVIGQAAKWTVRVIGHGGLAVACFFHPPLIVEAPHLIQGIEAAAQVAQIAGTLAPGP